MVNYNMWNGNNELHWISKKEEKEIDKTKIKNGLKPLFGTKILMH